MAIDSFASWLTARYDNQCVECEENIYEGDRIVQTGNGDVRVTYCGNCGEEVAGPDPMIDELV